jgi:hypothetical protein
MKRIWIVLLALVLLCGMIACQKPTERTAEGQESATPEITPEPERTAEPATETSAPTPEPTPEPEPTFIPGTYGVVGCSFEGVTLDMDQMVALGIQDTKLTLNEDGTGAFFVMGSVLDVTWTQDGAVMVSGAPYTSMRRIDEETIEMDYLNGVLTLKAGAVPPEPVETPQPTQASESENINAEPLFPGVPYGGSDGVIDRAKLAGLYRWMCELPGGFLYSLTFDEIGEAAGKPGRDNRNNNGKTHSANWSDGSDASITVTFKDNGDGNWACCAIAISGMGSDEYGAADLSGFPKIASSTPAGTNPVEEEKFVLKVGYTDAKVSVTAKIPTANWYAFEKNGAVRIYCAPSAEKAESSGSYILIECKESEDKINFYLDSFENLVELTPKTISGIEMTGREYDNVGMHWIEYYGEIAEGVWASIKLTGVDLNEGTETEAILIRLTFAA